MFDPSTKILIVDDMMTMRKMVGKVCKEIGFTNLTEAADGALAWEQVANAKPPFGLIISDLDMPNCSGLDFLKRVRSDQRFRKTAFILFMVEGEQDQITEAVRAGVNNYVIKPFTANLLKAKLEEVYKSLLK